MEECEVLLSRCEAHNLIPIVETQFSTKDAAQVLLMQYPDFLPGDQINLRISTTLVGSGARFVRDVVE